MFCLFLEGSSPNVSTSETFWLHEEVSLDVNLDAIRCAWWTRIDTELTACRLYMGGKEVTASVRCAIEYANHVSTNLSSFLSCDVVKSWHPKQKTSRLFCVGLETYCRQYMWFVRVSHITWNVCHILRYRWLPFPQENVQHFGKVVYLSAGRDGKFMVKTHQADFWVAIPSFLCYGVGKLGFKLGLMCFMPKQTGRWKRYFTNLIVHKTSSMEDVLSDFGAMSLPSSGKCIWVLDKYLERFLSESSQLNHSVQCDDIVSRTSATGILLPAATHQVKYGLAVTDFLFYPSSFLRNDPRNTHSVHYPWPQEFRIEIYNGHN